MEGQQALPDIWIQVPGSELGSNQPDCHSAPRWQIQQPFTIKSKRMDMHEKMRSIDLRYGFENMVSVVEEEYRKFEFNKNNDSEF